ncbi:hypothetical protein D3C85_1064090 [compost metagenome]
MIQVRLASPDLGARAIEGVEFVVPAAMGSVDQVAFAVFPETPVPGFVLRLARALEQGAGRRAGLAVNPMQALAHHRLVAPVEGVDQAWRAIDVPGVKTVAGKQSLRVNHQPARGRHARQNQRRLKVHQQPRPFKAMAWRGAVGSETIGRTGLVVLAQRLPLSVKMLDDPIVVSRRMTVDHPLDNPQRAAQPAIVLGDIGQGEEGFGGVHVAVGTAIGLLDAPVAAEGFAQGALLLAPEMLVDDIDRLHE